MPTPHAQSGELRCTVIHKEDDYTAFFDFLAMGKSPKSSLSHFRLMAAHFAVTATPDLFLITSQ
jgi:hypothetical protein